MKAWSLDEEVKLAWKNVRWIERALLTKSYLFALVVEQDLEYLNAVQVRRRQVQVQVLKVLTPFASYAINGL
jgi:hypothetical protein